MGIIKNLKEEVRIIKERDPAIHSSMEVLLYPSFKVMLHYRLAHKLYLSGHYFWARYISCLLYTSPSPRDRTRSRMPSSA